MTTKKKIAKPIAKKPVAKTATKAKAKAEAPPPKPKPVKLTGDRLRYQKMLLELRDHLLDRINFLGGDNLNRSQRESSGDLSGYGFHMADAGTDNFDREFALSLMSSEQDGLYEVEEAIKRLEAGTYGICELCEKAIKRERLEAVPFTRLCLNCQASTEKNKKGMARATSSFAEKAEDEGGEDEEEETTKKEKES
jgi:RNA polymerase-binding transcription factor DksA